MITSRMKLVYIIILLLILPLPIQSNAEDIVLADSPEQFLCGLPSIEQGKLFEETWNGTPTLPNEVWDTLAGNWVNPNFGGSGTIRQDDNTPNQINIAYELSADVADGTIRTCMQLLDPPTSDSPIPHGVVFRYQDENNFFGVGFLNNDEIVFGRMENGVPYLMYGPVPGYTATDLHYFEITLERERAFVSISTDGENFTPLFDVSDIALGNFRAGKVGLGTYGIRADFGFVSVDFDCSNYINDLSPISEAVWTIVQTDYFCKHQGTLHIIPDGNGTLPHDTAFLAYADAIARAKSEVSLTTMLWENPISVDDGGNSFYNFASSGNIILAGTSENASGLRTLYQSVSSNPTDYPDGMFIRILLGKRNEFREHILTTL